MDTISLSFVQCRGSSWSALRMHRPLANVTGACIFNKRRIWSDSALIEATSDAPYEFFFHYTIRSVCCDSVSLSLYSYVCNSHFLPIHELLLQMLLQFGKSIAELFATTPASEILLEIALFSRLSSCIVMRQWEVINWHEEWCRKTIVVFPVFQTLTVSIHR